MPSGVRRRRLGGTFVGLAVSTLVAAGVAHAQFAKKPSQMVELAGHVDSFNSPLVLPAIAPDLSSSSFTVPAGQIFVIKSITVRAYCSSGSESLSLFHVEPGSDPTFRLAFEVPCGASLHLTYPTGIEVGEGIEVAAAAANADVQILGYLAPDV